MAWFRAVYIDVGEKECNGLSVRYAIESWRYGAFRIDAMPQYASAVLRSKLNGKSTSIYLK